MEELQSLRSVQLLPKRWTVIWIVRYGLAMIVAAAMSVVGWQLMFHFPAVWELSRESFVLVFPSVVLWVVLFSIVRRTTVWTATALGFLSPLIVGAVAVCGVQPLLWIVVSYWYVTLPTGAVTGFLIHRCVFLGDKARPSVARALPNGLNSEESSDMMNLNEFEQTLQMLLKRTPFQPFFIELDDGGRWLVEKKEDLMYLDGPTGVYSGRAGFMAFLECHNVVRFHELAFSPTT